MTIYIAVDNTAPVAPSAVAGSPGDVIDGGTINEDTSTVLDLSILITDAEGDNVTYTFTDPANGTLSLSGTDLTYSPDPDYPYAVKPDDTDSFTLTVSDMPGSENSYTVNVTVTHVNDPPVAYDDSGWVSSSFTATIPLVGTDIDGDSPLFYSIVGAPTKGTLGAVTGNQVDYTSFYGAWGIDTFTDLVVAAKMSGAIDVSGSWITWQEDGKIIHKSQGEDKFAVFLLDNPELQLVLKEKCLRASGLSVRHN